MLTPTTLQRLRCGKALLVTLAVLASAGAAQAGAIPGGAIDYAAADVAGVPALSEWSLALAALLVAALAYRVLRGRVGGRLMSNLLIVGGAVAAAFTGHGVIREAEAISPTDIPLSSTTGGTVLGNYWVRLTNTSGIAQKIVDIRANRGVVIESPPPEAPECTIGAMIAPGGKCNVSFIWYVDPRS